MSTSMRVSLAGYGYARACQVRAAAKAVVESLEQRMLLSAATDDTPVHLEAEPTPRSGSHLHEAQLGDLSIGSQFLPISWNDSRLYLLCLDAVYGARGQIVVGPDGNMWFTEPSAGKVGRTTHAGKTKGYSVFTDSEVVTGRDYLGAAIVVGADGNLYFPVHEESGWLIGRMTPQGKYSPVTQPQVESIGDMVLGADGNVWFAQRDGKIGRINPDGSVSRFAVEGATGIAHLAVGTDGQVWFVAYDKQNIFGKIAPDGTITTFDGGFFADRYINDLVANPAGGMYLAGDSAIGTISADGQIGVTSLPNTYVAKLVVENDGTLWFIDGRESLNPLARLKNGTVSHFALTDNSARIASMVMDASGRLWLTADSSPEIQRVKVEGAIVGQMARVIVDHRTRFNKVVGSFMDLAQTPAGNYSAMVDWGNGTTAVGTVVANQRGGYDIIATGNLRRGWHTATITVRAGNRCTTFQSSVYAVPPAIAAKGATVQPIAGQVFKGTVATYVGVDVDNLGWYSATIYWGDGSSTIGELVVGEDGMVSIVGTYTYATPGLYDIQVYVQENDPNVPRVYGSLAVTTQHDARSRAVVAAGVLDGRMAGNAIVGVKTPVIARFAYANANDDAQHYRAVIEWGSGQQETALIKRDGASGFKVCASRVFLQTGSEWGTVRIYDVDRPDDFGTVAIVRGSISIQSHLSVTASLFTATAGEQFRGIVGSVTSVGSGTLWSSEFTATIDWGDGETSVGQVVADGSGGWSVIGTHTYAITGRHEFHSVRVSVEETRTPLDPTLPTPVRPYVAGGITPECVHILPGDIGSFRLFPPSWSQTATAEQDSCMVVATLAVQDPAAQPSDFAGEITWDDGGTSTVEIGLHNNFEFVIYAWHRFTTAGKHTGTLTITCGGVTRTLEVSVQVHEPLPPPKTPVASIAWSSISAVVGVEFSGMITTFTPRDAGANPEDFTVTIWWSDGVTSEGVVTRGEDGQFVISGTHTYYREYTSGSYRYLTVVVQCGQEQADGVVSVEVTRNPNYVHAEGRSEMKFRQREELTTKVASFVPVSGATLDQYEVRIDWGDGQVTQGTISQGYDGWFDVSGTTTYKKSGSFTIRVTIIGPGGPVRAQSFIDLTPDPVDVTPTQPVLDGLKIDRVLASFIDEDGGSTNEYQVTYAALIDWGDGSITAGTIDISADGHHRVLGSHMYATPGDYRVRLIVRRNMRLLPRLAPPPGYWPGYTFRREWIDCWDGRGSLCTNGGGVSNPDIEQEFGHDLFTLHVTGAAGSAGTGVKGGSPSGLLSRPKKRPRRTQISGVVFTDANANGRRDKKETGLAGWRVFIDADGDGVFDRSEASAVTDAKGRYVFKDVTAGNHVLRVAAPPRRKAGNLRIDCVLRADAGPVLDGQHFGIRTIKAAK